MIRRFVAGKTYFESFYEKIFDILVEYNIDKGYDWLCDLFFDFEEALFSFKIENFDCIIKFSYVDNVAEDLSPASFTKVVTLRI